MSVDRIVSVESGGNPYAKNPRSSATGAGQFIDSTWLNTIGKYRPDLVQGLDRNQILALRTDPALSKEMTGYYAKENQGLLSAAGVPVNDGTTYLAHFAGPQGAIKVLQADPNAPAISVLDPDGTKGILRANPFLKDMTASQLASWANTKMGGQSQPAQPSTPDMADWHTQQQPAKPMGILPAAASAPAAQPASQGLLAQAPQQSPGLLGAQNQAPPELEDLASLLQPQFRQMAPKRGLPLFRG